MSKFTLSIKLNRIDEVSDIASITQILTNQLKPIDPECLISLLTYIQLGTKPNYKQEPGRAFEKDLSPVDQNRWHWVADKMEEITKDIRENVDRP